MIINTVWRRKSRSNIDIFCLMYFACNMVQEMRDAMMLLFVRITNDVMSRQRSTLSKVPLTTLSSLVKEENWVN